MKKEKTLRDKNKGCGMKLREGFADENICGINELCFNCENNYFQKEKNKAYNYVESMWKDYQRRNKRMEKEE